MFRKICICFALAIWMINSAYAGSEDWNGAFRVKAINNQQYTIYHTPKFVRFLFITAGKCISLAKGSSLNGLQMPADVNICTDQNVEDFSKELQKFSSILDTSIELGSTYPK